MGTASPAMPVSALAVQIYTYITHISYYCAATTR